MNRNSNYDQNHQEKLLKIRKLEIFFSVEAARLRFWPATGSLMPSWAFGPTANDRATKPARLGSPSFPSRAASRPTSRPGAARRRIPIGRPSGHFGGPKPAGADAPPNPNHFHFPSSLLSARRAAAATGRPCPCRRLAGDGEEWHRRHMVGVLPLSSLLSFPFPFSLHDAAGDGVHGGRRELQRRRRPPRRRVPSPLREGAAVERFCYGARASAHPGVPAMSAAPVCAASRQVAARI